MQSRIDKIVNRVMGRPSDVYVKAIDGRFVFVGATDALARRARAGAEGPK